MINQKLYSTLLLLICFNYIIAQDTYLKNKTIDIQHYIFNLELNDADNSIKGGSGYQRDA